MIIEMLETVQFFFFFFFFWVIRDEMILDLICRHNRHFVIIEATQLDSTLPLKKAIYAARQSETAKCKQVSAKATTIYLSKQKGSRSLSNEIEDGGITTRSVAHQKATCPTREATCFNCRQVGHFLCCVQISKVR